MALLNVPPLSSGTVSSAADRQDIMNILGVNTPQVNHTQASPATTWGTVHSSQVPSRSSNNPSHNPSISDLGLLGLPEPTALLGSSDEDSQSDSSVGGDSDSIDHDDFMTPRSRPLSYGRSVASSEHTQPAHTTQGMGIFLEAGTRQPVRQTIRGPQELEVVTESLMRLVDDVKARGATTVPRDTHPRPIPETRPRQFWVRGQVSRCTALAPSQSDLRWLLARLHGPTAGRLIVSIGST
ncbi:uncharacterized protein B0H18DRAFT_465133 [Fomitopsis serialis]|uniref:uncharacterized protein n=1 Tax=Fomitopsis serialis TaxID=139415 RepID=UPI0020079A57|nr:uncharacterized protein B0H18DRAFT_465133 [Neoantrodia serialis]KAH9923534.1 hypothetical protein B0H18DRAFT_465133 [Neoantrodia serialis]